MSDHSKAFVKSGLLVFVASAVANVAAYIFQMAMGRMLPVVTYGELNALLSLFSIISVPAITIANILANFSARIEASGERAAIPALFRRSFIGVSVISLIVAALGLALTPFMTSFLKIPDRIPLLLVVLAMIFMIVSQVNLGFIQGLKRFTYYGVYLILQAATRVVFSVALVLLGLNLVGAVSGITLSSLFLLLFTVAPFGGFFRKTPAVRQPFGLSDALRYSLPVTISGVTTGLMLMADVVIAKHFLSPRDAGLYSGISIIGKIVFYLPASIQMVLFPIVSSIGKGDRESFRLLKNALLFTLLLSGSGALIFELAPSLVVTILFGAKFAPAIGYIGFYGLAMLPLSLAGIIVNFNLARHSNLTVYLFFVVALVEIGCMWFFHSSIRDFISILFWANTAAFLVGLVVTFAEYRQFGLKR